MKNSLGFIVSLIVILSCSDTPPKTITPPVLTPAKEVALEPETVEMTIQGMMCAIGCAARIEKKLINSEGIEEAQVNFDSKKAIIRYDKTFLNPTKITEIIQAIGDSYTVSGYSIQK